jgi:hypothetical protein
VQLLPGLGHVAHHLVEELQHLRVLRKTLLQLIHEMAGGQRHRIARGIAHARLPLPAHAGQLVQQVLQPLSQVRDGLVDACTLGLGQRLDFVGAHRFALTHGCKPEAVGGTDEHDPLRQGIAAQGLQTSFLALLVLLLYRLDA